ncbi:MAG: hypothetical protein M9894_25490 [Planctomycetes bacterium]|nr:hypothetical protein [Planctomycetota bacterium]
MTRRASEVAAARAVAGAALLVGAVTTLAGAASGRLALVVPACLFLGVGLVAALVARELSARSRPPEQVAPPPALQALARRLTRTRMRLLGGEGWALEGRLDGERVTVEAWEAKGLTLRLAAHVPVALTGKVVNGFMRTPALRDGAPPPAPLREEPAAGALVGLLAAGGEVDVGLTGLEVTVPDRPGSPPDLERLARALITVAAAVRTDTPPPPDPRPRLLAARTRPSTSDAPALSVRRSETVCPYCRDALDEAQDEVVACAACGTLHHAACFEEHRRCTVRGCERRRAERVSGS